MKAIEVQNVDKIYRLYDKPTDRLKEAINPLRKKYHKDFYALRDISFEVEKGDTVGIIGRNGSGKSTLLKLITGILTPSAGSVNVNGKVSALLELGAGFNMEYTGIENIYMNGMIMGYSRAEMDEKLDDILSFADIGDFVKQPVKTYSSGMFVRLAFSVATNIDPEILIVDEALSVGDMFFQSKCIDKMKRMIDNGTTLVFVSHDMGSVKSVCRKCILLNDGRLIDYDKSDKVIEEYFEIKVKSEQRVIEAKQEEAREKKEKTKENKQIHGIFTNNGPFQKRAKFQRIQNGKASLANVQLLDENGREASSVDYGKTVTLRMAIEAHEDIPLLLHGYHIRDKHGVDLVYSDSEIENNSLKDVKKGSRYIVDWKFSTQLIQGDYNIACVLSIPINLENAKVDFCDFVPLAVQFNVMPRRYARLYGGVHWDNSITIKNIND